MSQTNTSWENQELKLNLINKADSVLACGHEPMAEFLGKKGGKVGKINSPYDPMGKDWLVQDDTPSPREQGTRSLDFLTLHPPPVHTQLEVWQGKGGEIFLTLFR